MGLKDLHGLPGDDGAPHATDQLLRFSGKHHSRDHLDPAWSGSVKHLVSSGSLDRLGVSPPDTKYLTPVLARPRVVASRQRVKKPRKLADFLGIPYDNAGLMRVF